MYPLGMVVGIPTAKIPDPGPDTLFIIPIPTSRRDTANYPTAGRDVSGSVGTETSRQSPLGPDT